MSSSKFGISGVSAFSMISGIAFAAQPPCSGSDTLGNTACGNSSLVSVTTGHNNTAIGLNSLAGNTSGANNTASGNYALIANVSGSYNTALGGNALQGNTSGTFNTATGLAAMYSNKIGNNNTATGAEALFSNTTGVNNTATGLWALYSNTAGSNMVAVGEGALYNVNLVAVAPATDAPGNMTAVGFQALYSDTTGTGNTALGYNALYGNATGNNNTAVGYDALSGNATGIYATALGYKALLNSMSGLGNIGVGAFAGRNIIQGQLNLDIGSWGTADESNTIRIGLPQYHLTTYIAGIGNSAIPGGTPVVVDPATGQLGYAGSSERYKIDVSSLESAAERLRQLRPVSFHLKTDPNGAVQYGLIAEEVDKVYPELVIRDDKGKIQGVRYDELAPMLLSQAQSQQATIDAQAIRIASLEQRLANIQTATAKLQSNDEVFAQL